MLRIFRNLRSLSGPLGFVFFIVISSPSISFGQIDEAKTPYKSRVDESLTIRSFTVLPVFDNLNGIYARPIEAHLIELLKNNHHFDYHPYNAVGAIYTPADLEFNPDLVMQISRNIEADAIISMKVEKGPKGIRLFLDIFLKRDGKLLIQTQLKKVEKFEISRLKEEVTHLLSKALKKIPYDALIFSRQGNRVTINLGKRDGILKDKILSVIQIINVNRHPKFIFLINTEKEILGKIKLLKVDDTLSFGQIIAEKEKGAIQVGSKISGLDYVYYNEWNSLSGNINQIDPLMSRPDANVSFGKGAKAWVPKKPPTFGSVGAEVGLSLFSNKMQLASDSLSSRDNFSPSIKLMGELWLTPKWNLHIGLKQGIASTSNPLSGSSPSDLSYSISDYEFMAGYIFRGPDIWAPNVEILGGFVRHRIFVDDTDPRGFTTMSYQGLKAGVKGSYPIDQRRLWHAGAHFHLFLEPTLKESPASSGKSDNSVRQFGFFVRKKLHMNLFFKANLDFELYSTNFRGGSERASSASQKLTTFSGGVHYMF